MARPFSICVFCGSRHGANPSHRAAAEAVGSGIAARGWRLIYGGGGVGLMGVTANAAINGGGQVIGVIPEFLRAQEAGHEGVDDLIITDGMHDRKQIMFNMADAFLVLPGGIGTMDETVEILTWRQLGKHNKPIVMMDLGGYWRPLLAAFDGAVENEFMSQGTVDLLDIVDDVEGAFKLLEAQRQS